MTTDQAVPVSKATDRGTSTRGALLAAAREVFTLVGYAQAGVSDIVTLAGASVGSLYHHFSGKADLYLTLFEELSSEHTERTRTAVRQLRGTGVTDPMQLFLVGAGPTLTCASSNASWPGCSPGATARPASRCYGASGWRTGCARTRSSSRAAASHWTRRPRS